MYLYIIKSLDIHYHPHVMIQALIFFLYWFVQGPIKDSNNEWH